uniref:Uncharacterized protein n=1 Tax=Medicago truncatula TaxID=3880 RepID=A2Q625_MEDTR|nr:hypothetical protein MtrDRAFT_AC172742g25v1 [Medicago truncatula]
MHIGEARHLKICEVLGKMKNEDLNGLKRRYRGKNFIPKFQDILHGSKHPKDEETCIFSTGHTHMRPGAQNGAPGAHEFAMGRLAPKTSLICA